MSPTIESVLFFTKELNCQVDESSQGVCYSQTT